MSRLLTAAVVVCTASAEREVLLRACVHSLIAGARIPDEVLVVVDGNPALEAGVATWLPPRARLLRTERRGNSEARNVGLSAASAQVVAFVDDDATVERGWLAALIEPLEESSHVLGTGGAVLPHWEADRRWLPDELLWAVGCTYRGHREDPGPLRNPIGCNMAFRRNELIATGGFAAEFGKRGNALVICDETELSLRLTRTHGPGRIRYVPSARVHHVVPASRIGWKALARRCTSEGLSKGRLQRLYPGSALSAERGYVVRLVREAIPRLLFGGLARRDARSLQGAAAILLSLCVTGTAFIVGATRVRRRGSPRSSVVAS
jgi:cellulose synthase/poly-beta-1,6-N-acetylglucosamine synthase-like glycosyltransferase